MRTVRQQSGQSTAEYAIVIAIVLAAVVGMQTFVKRGLQGRYKDVTDNLTRVANTTTGNSVIALDVLAQYEPYYAKQNITTALQDDYSTVMAANDQVTREGFVSKQTRQSGGFTQVGGSGEITQDAVWTGP